MQRIQQFATTLACASGLLLLGCQPSTQTEPPPDESAMPGQTPGQTQPMEGDDAMPEETYSEEDVMREDRPSGEEMTEEPQKEQLSQQGEQFIQEAGVANMAEIELSKAVVDKVKDQKVREYAQRMIDDHTKLGEEMTTLANTLGATVPSELSESAKQKKEELQKLSGKKLQDRYIDIMVDDHEKVVELFRDQSENEEDPQLQTFASKNLPMLQEHLDRAKAIDEGKPYTGPQAHAPKAKAGKVASKP